jgi:hypothetical protein
VDEAIVDLVGVSLSTVHRVRQQFVEEGLEASLCRKPVGAGWESAVISGYEMA